jgi:hypothetical protein
MRRCRICDKIVSPSGVHPVYPDRVLSFRARDREGVQPFTKFQLNVLYQRIGNQRVLFTGISMHNTFCVRTLGTAFISRPHFITLSSTREKADVFWSTVGMAGEIAH